jgi:hypothetical protein
MAENKKADKDQDLKTMKGMTSKQKSAFKKGDIAMDKKKLSRAADIKADKVLAAKVKKAK